MDNQNLGGQMPPQTQPPIKPRDASTLNKGLIIGLSVGIILLIAVIIYLFTAKQAVSPEVVDDNLTKNQEQIIDSDSLTANWQIYNKNGVSFKYPNDWVVKTESGSVRAGLNIFLQERKYANEEVNPFGLSIADAAGIDLSNAKSTRVFDVEDMRNTNFLENVISIYFKEGSKTYLSSCIAEVDVCNKIIATFISSNSSETSDWKTYSSKEYGFGVEYPSSLKIVGTMSQNSVLGTAQAPVPGVHIGPLVFVIRQTNADRQAAQSYINSYLDIADRPVKNTEGPSVSCKRQVISNPAVTAVACGGEGGAAYYALIKGYEFDIFVDGYSAGFGQLSNDQLGNFDGYEQINQTLSTFKFIN